MPNLKGGSGYKKKKKGGGDEDMIIIADMEEDQIFGRIIKVLGNCNMLVYCDDGRERICHIRGKMRSRMYVHVGDIVIISTRDFEKVEAGKLQRGDICHKYDTKHHSALRKKFPNINPDIFVYVDPNLGKKGDNGFEFEGEAEDIGEIGSDDENATDSNAPAAMATSTTLGGNHVRPIDLIRDDDNIEIDNI
jgi:translation initiation factor 1A